MILAYCLAHTLHMTTPKCKGGWKKWSSSRTKRKKKRIWTALCQMKYAASKHLILSYNLLHLAYSLSSMHFPSLENIHSSWQLSSEVASSEKPSLMCSSSVGIRCPFSCVPPLLIFIYYWITGALLTIPICGQCIVVTVHICGATKRMEPIFLLCSLVAPKWQSSNGCRTDFIRITCKVCYT